MGLPVISSNVGGISEMVNNSNGVLINSENEEELLLTLEHFLDNYRKYDKLEIAKKAIEIYGYNQVGKAYFEVYNSVLNK